VVEFDSLALEVTMKRIALGVLLASGFVLAGWAVGRAQTPVADFEILIDAPGPGRVNLTCARGCSWREGQNTTYFTCGDTSTRCTGVVDGRGVFLRHVASAAKPQNVGGEQSATASAPWVTVSDGGGRERLSFLVQSEPFKPGVLPRGGEARNVRDTQGRTITGFSYYAWSTPSGVRVLVLAALPAGEARPGSFPSDEPGTRYEQVASFDLKTGATRQVRELTDFGGEPATIRIVTRP
jgi:hypothetical protein